MKTIKCNVYDEQNILLESEEEQDKQILYVLPNGNNSGIKILRQYIEKMTNDNTDILLEAIRYTFDPYMLTFKNDPNPNEDKSFKLILGQTYRYSTDPDAKQYPFLWKTIEIKSSDLKHLKTLRLLRNDFELPGSDVLFNPNKQQSNDEKSDDEKSDDNEKKRKKGKLYYNLKWNLEESTEEKWLCVNGFKKIDEDHTKWNKFVGDYPQTLMKMYDDCFGDEDDTIETNVLLDTKKKKRKTKINKKEEEEEGDEDEDEKDARPVKKIKMSSFDTYNNNNDNVN